MHRDPYEPSPRPHKKAPERKPEPADFFQQEWLTQAPGARRRAAPREPWHYVSCRYVGGRHVQAGYACPHRVEDSEEITDGRTKPRGLDG